MNQFTNIIQIELRDNTASVRMELKHLTMPEGGCHKISTDLRHTLRSVIFLNSL